MSLVEHHEARSWLFRVAESLRSLRISQWVKNGLIFVPIVLAHEFRDIDRLLDVAIAFISFSLLASGTYLINDIVDLDADRAHPAKRDRPIARGSVTKRSGMVLATLLIATALGLGSFLLPGSTIWMLLSYLGLTLAYSFYLKQSLLLDVILLAGLYTLRIVTGGIAAGVEISPWLLAYSSFLFISLALVKRYVELRQQRDSGQNSTNRRAYRVEDIEILGSMGITSGYLSVLVLCLFVSSDDVSRLYGHPGLLWLMSPIMLYWTSRIWLLARRGEVAEDPVSFAIRDPQSYVCALLLVVILTLASQ